MHPAIFSNFQITQFSNLLVRPPYLLRKLFPQALWRMDKTQKKIYLTFDDGPVPDITPWVLDILKQYQVKATFFCVGENVQKHSEIYQRILNEKHSIGNHTFHHLKGWNTNTKEYIQNIELCNNALMEHNPNHPSLETSSVKPLFRPPYGRIRKSQLSIIKSQLSIIMWDVLSGDYNKSITAEKCLKNTKDAVRNGSIIVFHDSIKAQKKLEYALPRFIEYAKEEGFEFASLK